MTTSAGPGTRRTQGFGPSHPRFPPRWAERFGEDRHGIFAEFDLRGVTFAWRWIPPGRFLMGSPDDEAGRHPSEGPQHEVTLTHGFWMGTTPVTHAQWAPMDPTRPSYPQGMLHVPKTEVSWADCRRYARALSSMNEGLSADLPTEAQWEYACRAGSTGAFHDDSPCTVPVGLDPALDKLGWFDGNSGSREQVVGQKRCNAWGLYDMHGNVQEWCRDAMRVYSDAAQWNPTGADPALLAQLGKCVLRGGSSSASAYRCRSSSREEVSCGLFGSSLGFRLVATHPFGAA